MTAEGRATDAVLREVAAERARQEAKWGEQNHPNGTGGEPGIRPFGYCDAADLADWLAHPNPGTLADFARHRCEVMFSQGDGSYEAILTEEWGEALSEPDPAKLRVELLQIAAVAVAWVEKIDRDNGGERTVPPGHGLTLDQLRAAGLLRDNTPGQSPQDTP